MGKRRKTTKATRLGLYAAAQYLGTKAEKELGLQIPFDVYPCGSAAVLTTPAGLLMAT